jgi:hypothetical protein
MTANIVCSVFESGSDAGTAPAGFLQLTEMAALTPTRRAERKSRRNRRDLLAFL